jgi:hypothetical protein
LIPPILAVIRLLPESFVSQDKTVPSNVPLISAGKTALNTDKVLIPQTKIRSMDSKNPRRHRRSLLIAAQIQQTRSITAKITIGIRDSVTYVMIEHANKTTAGIISGLRKALSEASLNAPSPAILGIFGFILLKSVMV